MKDHRRCTDEQRELYEDLPREHQQRWKETRAGSATNGSGNGHSWLIRTVLIAVLSGGAGSAGTWYAKPDQPSFAKDWAQMAVIQNELGHVKEQVKELKDRMAGLESKFDERTDETNRLLRRLLDRDNGGRR